MLFRGLMQPAPQAWGPTKLRSARDPACDDGRVRGGQGANSDVLYMPSAYVPREAVADARVVRPSIRSGGCVGVAGCAASVAPEAVLARAGVAVTGETHAGDPAARGEPC